ncbi:MAG: M28 family peptidase [Phycisphaeraceae bacterium]|nr:M28 family peptidase [Phycisphaeraceae bacterium]MCW5753187.1 M28 family peptidase [Phycisphaeraceae bacterium]
MRRSAAFWVSGFLIAASAGVLVAWAPAADVNDAGKARPSAIHVEAYRQHVFTLSSPFFEGRAPGTEGNRRAADYLEFHFKSFGLEPAFPDAAGTPNASFRQTLDVGGRNVIKTEFVKATFERTTEIFVTGRDYTAMDYSGSGVAHGPLVFIGYGIENGPNGFSNIPADLSLAGKIAMVFRFEPMDAQGQSQFGEGGAWSAAADLERKLKTVASKGAAGIILVNPPGAADPRASRLAGLNSFSGADRLAMPVVMMTTDAAGRMVAQADQEGRSLHDLRVLADTGQSVVELDRVQLMLAVEVSREGIETDNVAGVVRGRGALADEYVVIGAHYDHVGYGNFGSLGGRRAAGQIHPGADDNASGTSGMLLLAQRIAEAYSDLSPDADMRSFLFMGFTAEEMGLIGSRYYTRNMALPQESHYLMINLDMIGRYRSDKFEVHGLGTAIELEAFVDPFLKNSGLEMARLPGGVGPSDHASFFNAGIPVLFFFTGTHAEYHRPTDVASLINVEGAAMIVDMVYDIALALAARTEPMTFQRTTRRGVGTATPLPQGDPSPGPARLRVRFGIMPGDYSGSVQGVLVDAVREGTSAEEAGLRAGDIITTWNGKPVTTVEDWMPLLLAHQPGDEVEIGFRRGDEELKTRCVLKAASVGG